MKNKEPKRILVEQSFFATIFAVLLIALIGCIVTIITFDKEMTNLELYGMLISSLLVFVAFVVSAYALYDSINMIKKAYNIIK